MQRLWTMVDGNEACAAVAYQLSDVIAIYPITPSSGMAEAADAWAAAGRPNLWGAVPTVVEMQSEGGAAGAVHGALQARRPGDDVHGQPGPAADDSEHVQDRRRADAGGLPRHRARRRDARAVDLRRPQRRDGRAVDRLRPALLGVGAGSAGSRRHRPRGDARIARCRSSTSSTASAPRTRPRRSPRSSRTTLRALIDRAARRPRIAPAALTPDHPVVRGTAQNPDVFFQNREAVNRFYLDAPDIVQRAMDRFAALTGRAPPLVRVSRCARMPSASSSSWGPGAETVASDGRRALERRRKLAC